MLVHDGLTYGATGFRTPSAVTLAINGMAPNKGEQDADIAEAIIAVGRAPSNWSTHMKLGIAYMRHEMFAEAVAPFERARELNTTQVATHSNLSTALTNSGDGVAGEAAARSAITLDPSAGGYFCLGNALRKQGKAEAAAAAFRKQLEFDGLKGMVRCNLGLALGEAGHHREALVEFQAALTQRPDSHIALDGACTSLCELGDYEAASSMARRLCEVQPSDTDAWLTLGFCLTQTHRFTEALAAFESLLARDPGNVKGNYNLVATLLNLDRPSDALERGERALRLGPAHSRIASLLAIARERTQA